MGYDCYSKKDKLRAKKATVINRDILNRTD